MQAAQCSRLLVEGNVALGHRGFQAMSLKFVHAKAARKKSALVDARFDFHDVKTGKRGLDEFQSRTLTWGIGTTNLPPHAEMPDICATISSRKFQGKIST